MPIFRYEATDRSGELRRGAMEASDEHAVRLRLQQMGFNPQAVAPAAVAGGQAVPGRQAKRTAVSAGTAFVVSSLSIADQAVFWRQIANLARSGFTPFDTFQSLGLRTRNGRIRRASLDVAQRVNAGSAVADAMAANGDVFGTDCRMAVLAGELGGFTADVYEDFATLYEQERQHRERYRWFRYFAYFMLVGGLIASHFLIFMSSRVTMHKLDALGGDAGAWRAYLGATVKQWLMQLITLVIPAMLAVGFGVPALLNWLERGPLRQAADWFTMHVPVLRRIKIIRALARFYRMLGRLVGAGVAPIQAWDAASEPVGNAEVTGHLREGRQALVQGLGFGPALRQTGLIPDDDVQLMTTGAVSGRLPETLRQLEADYNARWQSSSRIVRLLALGVLGLAYGSVIVFAFSRIFLWYAGVLGEVMDWMP